MRDLGLTPILMARVRNTSLKWVDRWRHPRVFVYYVDSSSLNLHLGEIHHNKDSAICLYSPPRTTRIPIVPVFEATYKQLAEDNKFLVLSGSIAPLIRPGVFIQPLRIIHDKPI